VQWVFLVAAGVLEVGWAISLKLTDGWTNLFFLGVNVAFGLAAAFCLSQAMRSIPVMTAYPIWKGMAIIGLFVWETWIDRQPISVLRALFAALIVVGIVGLKTSTVPTP